MCLTVHSRLEIDRDHSHVSAARHINGCARLSSFRMRLGSAFNWLGVSRRVSSDTSAVGYGRTSFSDPYGPSIYDDVVDTL